MSLLLLLPFGKSALCLITFKKKKKKKNKKPVIKHPGLAPCPAFDATCGRGSPLWVLEFWRSSRKISAAADAGKPTARLLRIANLPLPPCCEGAWFCRPLSTLFFSELVPGILSLSNLILFFEPERRSWKAPWSRLANSARPRSSFPSSYVRALRAPRRAGSFRVVTNPIRAFSLRRREHREECGRPASAATAKGPQ